MEPSGAWRSGVGSHGLCRTWRHPPSVRKDSERGFEPSHLKRPPPSDLFIQCESFKRLPLRKLQSGLGRPWPIMKISVLSGLPVPSNSWMERSSWPIMPGRAHRCVTDRMATDRARDSALEILNTNFKSSINVLRHKNPKPAHTSIAALQSFPWLIVTVATDRP